MKSPSQSPLGLVIGEGSHGGICAVAGVDPISDARMNAAPSTINLFIDTKASFFGLLQYIQILL
jgi:hypothetical protein